MGFELTLKCRLYLQTSALTRSATTPLHYKGLLFYYSMLHCKRDEPLSIKDSDSKLLDSDSDSRKLRWIRTRVDSDSRQVDSDPDSRCPDSDITGVNILLVSNIYSIL